MDQPEQTFSTEGTPKLAFTVVQLVCALFLGILGGYFVGSSSVSDVLGSVLLCAAAGVAVHGILWLRSRVVVSQARVEIVSPFRTRTVARDQLDRFELGTNIQGRPVAVLVLRSGKRKTLYATLSWWGKEHRRVIQATVAQMNAAVASAKSETLRRGPDSNRHTSRAPTGQRGIGVRRHRFRMDRISGRLTRGGSHSLPGSPDCQLCN